MRSDSITLFITGAIGAVLGFAALLAGVQGVGAILCGLVFAIAALCLLTGWRFWCGSPLTRYDEGRRL
ncbi:MAG: hypothetical protein IT531_04220 [Burkholderiales bacterium]|nr:hypothetical protein [Burkholderiales bacterium]